MPYMSSEWRSRWLNAVPPVTDRTKLQSRRKGSNWIPKRSQMEDADEIPELEVYPCPTCGGMIRIAQMDFRFAGRYTCPHCGNDVVLPADQAGEA
jgi:rRNA maturation protein Nop10